LEPSSKAIGMDNEAGGWLWLLIDVGFVVILAAALIYGIVMWRNRPQSAAAKRRRDQATEKLYQRDDRSSSE
jgi:hypothetical protein